MRKIPHPRFVGVNMEAYVVLGIVILVFAVAVVYTVKHFKGEGGCTMFAFPLHKGGFGSRHFARFTHQMPFAVTVYAGKHCSDPLRHACACHLSQGRGFVKRIKAFGFQDPFTKGAWRGANALTPCHYKPRGRAPQTKRTYNTPQTAVQQSAE